EVLTDIPPKLDFFDALPEYDAELFVHQKSKSTLESSKTVLEKILPVLEALPVWDDESLLNVQTALSEQMGVKKSVVMWPVRIAAAGKAVTPGGSVEICRILGREETLRRLTLALEKLNAHA
ncbi:MAG: glutamate--tRNA ligase, partial [Oscillospiraceae bacterium]|nr:glutamate--tRNA ligase [Oscillospiraceae bacterium]